MDNMDNEANYIELLKAIQGIIDGYIKSKAFCDYRVGTVIEEAPLKIKISDRITLDESKLILTEQVLLKQLDLTHVHLILGNTETGYGPDPHTHHIEWDSQTNLTTLITITEGLKTGDKVHMLSVLDGQKFIVLSKVRDKKSVIINKDDNWAWK